MIDSLADSMDGLSITNLNLINKLPGELRNQIYSYLVPDAVTVDLLGNSTGAYRYDRLATCSDSGLFETYDYKESERYRKGCNALMQSSCPQVVREFGSLLRPVTVLEISAEGFADTQGSLEFLQTASDERLSQFGKFVIRTELVESADNCDDGEMYLCWSTQIVAQSALEVDFTGDMPVYRLHVGTCDGTICPFTDIRSWTEVTKLLGQFATTLDSSKEAWAEKQGMFETVHGALMKRKVLEKCGLSGSK